MKKIRTHFLAFGLLFLTIWQFQALNAQQRTCGTDELHEQMLQDPRYRRVMDLHEQAYQRFVEQPTARVTGGVRKIPVVVHFIQSSDITIVPDAEVYTQIDVLNEDFRKMVGTPGFGNGVDTEYEFCLATIDPDGCPTTGINRVVSPQYCYHEQTQGFAMKGLIQWDPYKYLNVWVPRTIETTSGTGQVIGYATFPFNLSIAPNLDGIVIHSGYFGRNSDPSTQGETTVHEVGHWLGMFHTFQNGCQGASSNTCASQGDRVCDTPQAAAANFGCPNINSCTDSPTDLFDQIENYMDYSNGSCQNMYTQGQKTRMDFYCNSIRTQIWSPANLTATGCDGTTAACAPSPDFEADNMIVCAGVPVQFSDLSLLTPTGWSWTFSGGTPSTSTLQNPVVTFNTPGIYDVSMVATNATGSGTETKVGYIEVVTPSLSLLQEGFEGATSLPQGWHITDNQGAVTWERVSNAYSQGLKSMAVRNFDARNAGESISLHSNPFSLQNMVSGFMTFDHSYKKYSGLVSDGLKVFISTDCGTTWQQVWFKGGSTLATTTGSASTIEWVPTLASHWKSDTIALDSFAGEPNVRVRFEARSAGGQTIYIDNINMNLSLVGTTEQAGLAWDFQVAPNPFSQDLHIDYTLQRPTAMSFVLMDISGKAMMRLDLEKQNAGRHQLPLSATVRDLPAGVYFLKGTGSDGTITRKLIKMN